MAIQSNFPAISPTLDLNFAGSRTVDPRIAFSRAGTGNVASYFDEKGVMQFAPPDTPRIDFDPVTLKCKGLLIEDQRTNLAKYSNEFTNSEWTKTRVLLSTDGTLGPNSDSLAYKIYQDTSENSTHVLRIANGSITAGRHYTFSIYVKADTIKIAYVQFRSQGFTSSLGVFFDIENATITTNQAPSWISARIEKVNNGFVRISVSSTCTTTYVGSEVVYFHVTNSVGSTSYTGDGVSGFYIWGAQFEEGEFPTSYIPTTSAQVTRATDSLSSASLGASGAGTVVINAQAQSGQTFLSSGNMAVLAPNSAEHRIAVGYDSTSTRSSTDGAAVVSSAGSTGGDDFSLMPGATGYVTRLSLYPRKLSDVNLQALTA